MPKCSTIQRKKRKICIGDMDEQIVLQSRNITPPATDGVDFSETFTGKATVWAMVNTVSGQTLFDGTGTERDITHEIGIRFLSGVTAEDWVLFNDERIDIVDVQDLEERHEFMLLKCSNRGTTANAANEL